MTSIMTFDQWELVRRMESENQAIVLVYNINNLKSFQWIQSGYMRYIKKRRLTNDVLIVCGNDQCEGRPVDVTEAKLFASSINALFMQVSSTTGANVMELFLMASEEALSRQSRCLIS